MKNKIIPSFDEATTIKICLILVASCERALCSPSISIQEFGKALESLKQLIPLDYKNIMEYCALKLELDCRHYGIIERIAKPFMSQLSPNGSAFGIYVGWCCVGMVAAYNFSNEGEKLSNFQTQMFNEFPTISDFCDCGCMEQFARSGDIVFSKDRIYNQNRCNNE